ncbi:MAG: exodeoxyribonuclease VII large subunit [Spirochaetes bacterium]|nr:exodeoxyribonuclease VII large subunit [Spirochaetota bacterium]
MEPETVLQERAILSVSQLTRRLKEYVSGTFTDIWVRGEISNYTVASSGHAYFTLKDETSVLRAVLFRGYQKDVKFEPADGIGVILHGHLDIFEKRGEYQVIVDMMEPEGKGSLQLAFEQLKAKLEKEGLFDTDRKKKIPHYPDTVGVVTSPSGAALRDILNVLGRRYSGVRVIVYPARVQGTGAAEEIADAIRKADARAESDVLIVGRGGGSVEDLWPFNEEVVARAISAARIPVISAVGHEIDFTISDFTADLRAPTPSAAAEIVVKNKQEVVRWSRELVRRLTAAVGRMVERASEKASFYSGDVLNRLIDSMIDQRSMVLDDLTRSLSMNTENLLLLAKGSFQRLLGTLDALSPLMTLSRGFSLITKLPENRPVHSVFDVDSGDGIAARLKDGTVYGTVTGVKSTDEGSSHMKMNEETGGGKQRHE